jgi:transposase-like protein
VTIEKPERETDEGNGNLRGRPGRRTAAEKREAVMSILGGKSTVDHVARQYGVHPETVVGWRDAALLAIEQAMNQGSGPTPRERELERENGQLKLAVQSLSVDRALAVQAIEEWKRQGNPSRPARSRR